MGLDRRRRRPAGAAASAREGGGGGIGGGDHPGDAGGRAAAGGALRDARSRTCGRATGHMRCEPGHRMGRMGRGFEGAGGGCAPVWWRRSCQKLPIVTAKRDSTLKTHRRAAGRARGHASSRIGSVVSRHAGRGMHARGSKFAWRKGRARTSSARRWAYLRRSQRAEGCPVDILPAAGADVRRLRVRAS